MKWDIIHSRTVRVQNNMAAINSTRSSKSWWYNFKNENKGNKPYANKACVFLQ